MIATLLTLLAIQAEPFKRPMTVRPSTDIVARPIGRQPTIAEGRALVARAEAVNAGYVPGAGGPSKAELQASIDQMKAELDSMSDLTQERQMRLQMHMEPYQKAFSMLSNIMKKVSDTQNNIVQNIK